MKYKQELFFYFFQKYSRKVQHCQYGYHLLVDFEVADFRITKVVNGVIKVVETMSVIAGSCG